MRDTNKFHFFFSFFEILFFQNYRFLYHGTNEQVFNTQIDIWTSSVLAAQSRNIPSRSVRVKPGSKPWYNSHLQYLAKCRDRLFRRSRKLGPNSKAMIAFRQVRNFYVAELRAAQERYFRNLGSALTDGKLDSRRWWMKEKKHSAGQLPAKFPHNLLVTSWLLARKSRKKSSMNTSVANAPRLRLQFSLLVLTCQSLQATLAFNFLKCLLWISLCCSGLFPLERVLDRTTLLTSF